MTCRECIEFLGRYLEDELPARQRRTFDAHLAECPACVHYLEAYRKTVELAQTAAEPAARSLPTEVPDDLLRAILAARNGTEPSASKVSAARDAAATEERR